MGQCWYPYHVERKYYTKQEDRYVPVPCNRCPECLQRRASIWGFRLRKEEERSETAIFATLTYAEPPMSPNGFMTLQKTDFQLFMKRLRKISTHGRKISYYACGEYGGKYKRPHYHAIIFNAVESDIEKAWNLGNTFNGTVSGASISYTVKYINKGAWKPTHHNDDRNPEFALMSKRMGANYLTEASVSHHRQNLDKPYIVLEGGIKLALPRYYKEKLWPVAASDKIIKSCPAILFHLDENVRLRKEQTRIIEKLQASKPPLPLTDLERHEARKNAINNFKNKYNKRNDL